MKEDNAFQLMLDTTYFGEYLANEIVVKVVDNFIEIHGKQGWRPYPGGSIRRSFDQKHVLPSDVDPDKLTAFLTPTGALFIIAPANRSPVSLSSGLTVKEAALINSITSAGEEEVRKKKVTMAPGTKYERDVPVSAVD